MQSIYFESDKDSQRLYYKLLNVQGFSSPSHQYKIGVKPPQLRDIESLVFGEHLPTGKQVVVKVIEKPMVDDVEWQCLRNEAEVLTMCKHPNI